MTRSSDLEREHGALRERLSRISEASRRSNESLEFDTHSSRCRAARAVGGRLAEWLEPRPLTSGSKELNQPRWRQPDR